MVKEIQQLTDTDIVWMNGKPEEKQTHLVVFNQTEIGFCPFITGMGLIGEEEPIAKIYSRLHAAPALNHIPEPVFPEWRLYQRDNDEGDRFFILRLTHFTDIEPSLEEAANRNVWIYSYPVIRDVLLALDPLGVDQLTYLATDTMSLYSTSNTTDSVEEGEIAVFDYVFKEQSPMTTGGRRINKDIVLPTPAWLFPELFVSFSSHKEIGAWVVLSSSSFALVDKGSIESMKGYCSEVLGLSCNEEKLDTVMSAIFDFSQHLDDSNPIDIFMSGFENSSHGGMFG